MGETASKNPPGFHPEFTLQKPLPDIYNNNNKHNNNNNTTKHSNNNNNNL